MTASLYFCRDFLILFHFYDNSTPEVFFGLSVIFRTSTTSILFNT